METTAKRHHLLQRVAKELVLEGARIIFSNQDDSHHGKQSEIAAIKLTQEQSKRILLYSILKEQYQQSCTSLETDRENKQLYNWRFKILDPEGGVREKPPSQTIWIPTGCSFATEEERTRNLFLESLVVWKE
jgi:hypothetical protein